MTTDNQAIKALILAALRETREWGWKENDVRLVAVGGASKALQDSGMDPTTAAAIATTMVAQIMEEVGMAGRKYEQFKRLCVI